MSVVMLEREIVHYEVLGRGRPVILLHGWVGSWRYWIPVMQAVSFSYRAYAIDFWGFGNSSKNPDRYCLDEQVGLLQGFMSAMGIDRAALIGHGLGALVALIFAERNPTLVDRVMAVSHLLEEDQLNNRLRKQPPAVLADWLLPNKSALTEPVRMDTAKSDPAAVLAALNGSLYDRYPRLSPDKVATCLLVHGQNDPLVSLPELEQASGLAEGIHAVVFDESGHFPMLDESSKFNRLAIDFLSLEPGESPRVLQLKEAWKRRVR
jgi:pimeloyl-ACP methyl ester carboxylesterase